MTSLWAEVNDILAQIAYVVNNKLMSMFSFESYITNNHISISKIKANLSDHDEF